MKSVMLSINPKWCELIALGKKTIEVRKTRPKLEPPFKVYIYMTKPTEKLVDIIKDGDDIYGEIYHGKPVFIKVEETSWLVALYRKEQKVIGEFVCDSFDVFNTSGQGVKFKRFMALHESCLTVSEMRQYLNGGIGYGWHISDLKIYDEPKEIGDFGTPCKSYVKYYYHRCPFECKYIDLTGGCIGCTCRGNKPLTRPPQSWCYADKPEDIK